MPTTDRTLVGRAAANLGRGLGGSLPLALLPPLLARELEGAEFAVWVLVVQFASYVAYLELGVQTAVSKTVATSYALGSVAATRGAIAAGIRLLVIAAAVGATFVLAALLLLPVLFDIPRDLTADARLSFAVLGFAAALALPASALHGALLGIGRNDLSAAVIVGSRLPSVALTVVGASLGWSIGQMSFALAGGSLINLALSVVAARSVGLPISLRGGEPADRQEIVSLTATFGVFTVATLLVTGIDVVVVGFVDFDRVAAYGLGASLVAVATAGYTLVATVLLPAFADAVAVDQHGVARRLALRSTALSSWVLAAGVVVAVAASGLAMSLWAGSYADESQTIFMLLVAAAGVRLSVSPMVQYLVGLGEHRRARIPAVGEASLNLALSVVLGLWIGARGVAVATLTAAVAAVIYYLVVLLPRVLDRRETLRLAVSSFAVPGAVAGAAIGLILLGHPVVTAGAVIVTVVVAAGGITRVNRYAAP